MWPHRMEQRSRWHGGSALALGLGKASAHSRDRCCGQQQRCSIHECPAARPALACWSPRQPGTPTDADVARHPHGVVQVALHLVQHVLGGAAQHDGARLGLLRGRQGRQAHVDARVGAGQHAQRGAATRQQGWWHSTMGHAVERLRGPASHKQQLSSGACSDWGHHPGLSGERKGGKGGSAVAPCSPQ